uniref:Uncharacterized protein n=1 Tax=Setaria italica TaxID=4555 RepID=K3Y4J5_SETIT
MFKFLLPTSFFDWEVESVYMLVLAYYVLFYTCLYAGSSIICYQVLLLLSLLFEMLCLITS